MFLNNSFEWAFRARKKFYDSLRNKDLKSIFEAASSNNVIITVFGKSQVGKTTLILKLSGICNEHFATVSKTLRGGSPPGSPCSPTAIIYKQSIDDSYYYSDSNGNNTKADDNKMCRLLKNLRTNVEDGNHSNLDKVEIHIPEKYYSKSESNNLKITIVDLPGYGSSSTKEHAHTEKLFKKYLPLSSLRLLVENANNIVSLEHINKGNRIAVDWQYQPEVYRVVLTRSASAESASKKILSKKNFSKDDLLTFYTDIFKNKLSNVPKDVKIYPLEYGESWDEQKRSNKKLHNSCDTIFEELLNNLREDIIDSADPAYQLITFSKTQKAIEKIKEDKIKNYEDKLNRIEDEKKERSEVLNELNNLIINKKTKIDNETKKLDSINEFSRFSLKGIKFSGDINKVTSLKTYIINYENEIRNHVTIYLENLENDLPYHINSNKLRINNKIKCTVKGKIEAIISGNLGKKYKFLNSYFMDTYFIKSHWKKDKESCINCCKKTKDEIIQVLEEELTNRKESYAEMFEKKLKKLEGVLLETKNTRKEYLSQLKSFQEEKECLLKEKEQYINDMNQDESITKKYLEFFEVEYRETFFDKWQELNKSENTYNKISSLVELVQINYEFYKLFNIKS